MADAYTTTTQLANLVEAAFDKLCEFALRDEPLFRMVADKKPAQ